MERCIFHSDLNSFYASVEIMLEPSLRGKAVAVCGSTEERHGIVLAKSQKAKEAGIKTGMVNGKAKELCPELIIVKPHYEQYLKYSELIRDIYSRYTDRIEPFGMDECWLDMTGFKEPENVADEIRGTIKEELGMTVSIGVSFNKIFAKLGSDMKKPDAVTVISKDNYKEKVWPLPASEMLFVGRACYNKLSAYGIRTIGQLAESNENAMQTLFGINGPLLRKYANGLDDSRVMHKDFVSPVKSVGHGTTCNADLVNDTEVWMVLLELAQDVAHRLRVHKLRACGVQLAVRDNKLLWQQFQCQMEYPSISPMDFAEQAFQLFKVNYGWYSHVRSLCIRAINLVPINESYQPDLFINTEKYEKREKLDNAIDDIRNRFGKDSIKSASLMMDVKTSLSLSNKMRMPGRMYS